MLRQCNKETTSNFKMQACNKVSLHLIEYFQKLVFLNYAIAGLLIRFLATEKQNQNHLVGVIFPRFEQVTGNYCTKNFG